MTCLMIGTILCDFVYAGYESQNKRFKKLFGSYAKVISMSYDGMALLAGSDVFIGSGGTMTVESALMESQPYHTMQYQTS